MISGASDFTISGDGSLVYLSRDTSHYYSHHCNGNGIYDDESLEVYAGYGSRGNRSLETSHSSFHNCGVYHSSDDGRGGSRSQETSHYLSCNSAVYHFGFDGRGVTRSQDTSHSSSRNFGARVDVYRRGGYRS